MTDTRTYNYLEIIFTFNTHPQYIARFGNFNINFFKNVLDFQAFIYQVLTDYHEEGVDSGAMPNDLRKISCYQRTSVDGWDDLVFTPHLGSTLSINPDTITSELVSASEMPSWYGSGKWLYNASAMEYLTKQGVEPRYEHSTAVVREMKCLPNFDGWYAYHEFEYTPYVPYVICEDNLIYFGKFEDCPVIDVSNIALTCADCNTATTASNKGGRVVELMEACRTALGDKVMECIMNGGSTEEAQVLLAERAKNYEERKGEFFGVPYTLEDGTEVDFNPAECDEPITYTELSPDEVRYAGGK